MATERPFLPAVPVEGFQGGPYGGRWYCTAFHPVPDSWKLPAVHMEAKELSWHEAGSSGDCYALYECPYCGKRFEEEIGR